MRTVGHPATAGTALPRRRAAWRIPRFFARPGAWWGVALTALVLLVMLVGAVYTPNAPTDLIGAPFEGSSGYAWLGTDAVGRDVLSRVMCGGGVILSMSALAAILGVVLGGLMGISAGYAGGLADDVIMRVMDVLLAFPQTILALLFVSVLGSSFWLIVILVAAIHTPQVARVIRAASLRAAGEDYVRYARAVGLPRHRIVMQEILPNVLSPLLVEVGLRFTFSIALIAGLSFLGLAQNPPAANWGLMVNENRIGIMQNPWPVVAPILLIAALTVGVNLLTDAYARYATGAPRAGLATPEDVLAPEDRARAVLEEREAL